jgi:2-dehydro-3-deoxyglucarate aldolase/4-hydroxy-2-oxoheptanedioate aldolase
MTDFRSRLRSRERLIGTLLTLGSSEIAEMVAILGFDWVWIDMEHTALTFERVQQLVQTIAGRMGTIVRVPWNDPVEIKRALDLGCDGVLVPQVKTADEAKAAVAAAKYPPLGIRSVGIARAQQYGMTLQDYVVKANDGACVLLQIEHVDAVPHLDEILSVPDVDGIVVGPYDLSASMGRPGQLADPDVAAAVAKIADACNARRMPWGAFAPDAESAHKQIKRGAAIVNVATDTMHFWRGARAALSAVRDWPGEPPA